VLRCAGTLSLFGKDVKGRLKRSSKLGLPITILETVLFQIASVSRKVSLKVHKTDNFVGFDFEFWTVSL
jgi:hypothetical protein